MNATAGTMTANADRRHWIAPVIIAVYLAAAIGVWLGWWGNEWAAITGDFREPPSKQHWLGTNLLGQDIFSRLLASTAAAFEIGMLVALTSTLLGAMLGGLAGYFAGRWIDELMLWLAGTLDAIPFYLFVAALAFAFAGRPGAMQAAMILTFWTLTARLVRAETLRLRQLDFVAAARVSGLTPGRIVRRHILPNTWHILLVQATLVFVAAIKAEVVLSFLGLGPDNSISWGVMIAEASQEVLAGHITNFIAASSALMALVLTVNHLADRLQAQLDPRTRRHPARRPDA
ncbi:ABC transporter permease [Wenzhouxiangella sp. XN201]|uniref:ABC transporter permease n=1 Tax=Wenzhouxiangella sp. XN201 TaxID=2710755 RepID=UPI0013C729E1|nr:ABC transporter permease [Wenzhouxiangella sp. XN201]NEZ04641.1 ABC transporter permease [Wenzhouxiangella sp. XN201]